MAWVIENEVEDYRLKFSSGYIRLNPDKVMNFQAVSYPITWTGFVDGVKVEIIQKSQPAISEDDFEFKTYPEKYVFLKRKHNKSNKYCFESS